MKKWLLSLLALLLLAFPSLAQEPKTFKRGAKRTPAHKLFASPQYQFTLAPAQYAVVPKQLDMWGNDQFGDCVSAEEAFAKACYSPEIFIDSKTVVAWAAKGGFRDGADLVEVMDAMRRNGFTVGQQQYNDGGYASVDYTNEATLQSAIWMGPVKIAIDGDALPPGAGSQQGWYALGKGRFPNTDHCVSICGFGPAEYLYQQLGVPMPAALAGKSGYLLFTWSTIGFVDHPWLKNTCTEAWVRNPTTVGVPPLTPPAPPTPPTPPPNPPQPPAPGTATITSITATFSDGSTQTLGNSGLTPEQLRGMTLQQLLDFIDKRPAPPPMKKAVGGIYRPQVGETVTPRTPGAVIPRPEGNWRTDGRGGWVRLP